MTGLQLVTYAAALIWVIVVAAKMIKIARMPVHIRWDLYPIPHEKGKGSYGGSYFEEVDWWTKPSSFSLIGEVKAMFKEIVFVHSVYENNRPLWIFSFPFHFGMYCLMGSGTLLLVGAIMQANGVEVSAISEHALGSFVHMATLILATAGLVLSTFGAVGLIFSRLFNREMRAASVLSDYVNLLFLLAVFATGLIAWATVDPSYAGVRNFVQSLVTLDSPDALPSILSIHFWITAALLIYFPFTHMTHMVSKYFTYHKIRWEDAPNTTDSQIDHAVQNALGFKVSWAAPHIKTGASWGEAATDTEEKKTDE